MEIRYGHLTDLPYLYDICHRTGDGGHDASDQVRDRFILGHVFAAPYLVQDPHWCWVATDRGTPVGYLLTTPDSRAFASWAEKAWRPALRALYPLPPPDGLTEFEAEQYYRIHDGDTVHEFHEEYPAHLHIDLLPQAQGHRLGTRLMELFLDQVRAEGVRGVHLGVSNRNPGAISFYRKLGFTPIVEEDWGMYLGMKT